MELLDQYGRAIKKGTPILDEIGVSGVRDSYSSYPSQGLTPDRLTAILKEADQGDVLRQSELFEEMEEKDSHLGSVLQTRKLAVTGLPWEVVAASEESENQKIADFVKEALIWVENWEDSLRHILDAVAKGFSVQEIMWEIEEGKVWIRELKWRHQKRFTFYSMNGILETPRLLTEAQPTYGEDLLPNKFVVFRHQGRSGPAPRAGLLRAAAWMYLFKNYTLKDWVIFNERFAMPMRVGKYQPGSSDEERKVLKQAVFNLGSDAAAVIPESTMIDLLEGQKSGSIAAFEKMVAYCNAALSKLVLGHSASADSTPGKLGSENEAREVRQDLLEADAKALAKAVTMQIVYPLVGFNFGFDKSLPTFKFNYEEDEDLEAIAETYERLSNMGLRIPTAHVYGKFGIPIPDKDEEVIEPVARPAGPGITAMKSCPGCNMKRMAMKDGDDMDEVDSLTERLLAEAPVEGLVEKVRELIETANTLEDVRDGILELYKDMDVTDLGNIIQKALVAADLSGRFRANDNG